MRFNKGIILITIFLVLFTLTSCNKKTIEDSVTDSNASPTINLTSTLKITDELVVEQVTNGVYVINHSFPWPANSLLVEVDSSNLLLVDTPYTPEATDELLNWIDNNFKGKREITAINTGFHFDNLGGNQSLIDRSIDIYGINLTEKLIESRGEDSRELFLSWLQNPKYKKYFTVYEDLEYVAPNKIFKLNRDQEFNFKIGNTSLEIYYPGETHSPDNFVVYLPDQKVLFGGCMIKELSSKDLGNVADADMEEWPKSIKKLLERYSKDNVDFVIPGHGKWGDLELINHTLELSK